MSFTAQEAERAKELKRIAMTYDAMPQDLTEAEKLYFCRIRYIARCLDMRSINRDAAKADADAALKQLERYARAERHWSQMVTRMVAMERAARAYEANKTTDNADAFMRTVYGLGRE